MVGIMSKKVIVLAANQAYVSYLETTIKSICSHMKQIKFYILNEDIPTDWFQLIENHLEKIDSGEIIYNGESLPIDELEKRNLLGFVFQDFQLFPHLTVLENLVLSPIKTMNMAKNDAEKKAIKLLEKLGLEKQINNYPISLSGGQKQRVALARAMMIEPKIIGYDEPTSALDPELRLEVEKLILKNRELGITQIVVTHDLQFAENIADSILKVEPK